MLPRNREHRMTDISSVTSSAAAMVAKPFTELNKAASAVTASFAHTLSKTQNAVGPGPKTGFTAGPTYEAGTLAGRTKSAFNNTLDATKSVLHIKP
jgi:hypothetical protein